MKNFLKYKNFIYIFVIFTLTFLTYFNTLYNQFVWDDEAFLEISLDRELSWENTIFFLSNPCKKEYLPLTSISRMIKFHFFGLNPYPYHVSILILYMINLLLIYLLILLIKNNKEIAFITVLLFSLHPVHCEVVAWFNTGNSYFLGYGSFLCAIICFIKYRKYPDKKIYYILSIILYFICMLFMPNCVILCSLFFVYDISFIKYNSFRVFLKKTTIYIPYIINSLLIIYITISITTRIKENFTGNSRIIAFLMDLHILTSIYVKNLIYPSDLNPMYGIKTGNLIWIIFSFILLILTAILIMVYRRTPRYILFFTMWFFIPLIPVSHFIVPVNFVAADRYIYISSISFCYALSFLLIKLYNFREKKICKILAISMIMIIITGYMSITINQNKKWNNNMTLWTYVYNLGEEYKTNSLLLYNLGHAYFQEGDFFESIKFFEESLKYSDKENYRLRVELGISYMEEKNYEKAFHNFRLAQEIEPHNSISCKNMGIVYYRMGEYNKAAEEFKKSLTLNPDQPDVRDFLDFLSSELIKNPKN